MKYKSFALYLMKQELTSNEKGKRSITK